MDKLKFHRDKMGIHVYYAGMNSGLRYYDYILNGDIKFSVRQNAVVPEPERISTVTEEEQVVGYISNKDGSKISPDDYVGREARAIKDRNDAQSIHDVNGEVRAEVTLRQLRETWREDRQIVKTFTDHKFEIIDIEYPADDRLVPIRHYDDKMVGYFKVDGKFVVTKLAKELCENAGLVSDATGSVRGKYHAGKTNYYGWKLTIEGDEFGKPVNEADVVKDFTGTMAECHEFIKKAEEVTRDCFDEWIASRKYPDKLTIGQMLKHLNSIESRLTTIDYKVKSRTSYQYTKEAITKAKSEILQAAKKLQNSDDIEVSETAQ